MIDIRVGVSEAPAALIGIDGEIPRHVFVNFLLQIDADGPVRSDNFVGADSGVRGNIPARVGDANVFGDISNLVVRALDGGCDEAAGEIRVGG